MDTVELILTKFVTCESCHIPYSTSSSPPLLLPCKHSFCKKCILSENNTECPKCQKEYSQSEELPEDGRIQVIQKLKQEINEKSTCLADTGSDGNEDTLCDFCGENSVHFNCKECQAYMCEDCKEMRHIGKMFKRHHVAAVEKSTSSKDSSLKKVCQKAEHEGKFMELFCYADSCQYLLCSACSEDHGTHSHKVLNLEMAWNQLKNDIQEVIIRLQSGDTSQTKEDMCKVLNFLLNSDKMFLLDYGPACLGLAEDLDSEVSPDDLENLLLSAIEGEDVEFKQEYHSQDEEKPQKDEQLPEDIGAFGQEVKEEQADKAKDQTSTVEGRSVMRWILIGGMVAVMFHFIQKIINFFSN